MSASSIPLTSTADAFDGGVAYVPGQGQTNTETVSGSWLTGDRISIGLTNPITGIETLIGAGSASGIKPYFCFTFSQKVYVLSGATAYFSAIDDPTKWNDPAGAGNGFVETSNFFAAPENLFAIAPYQGRLLLAARRCVQIWQTDPDPVNYALTQTLPNIGTIAKLSVKAIGDMDVYLLADNGVRSVRVRDASNNAIIADVGTPVDMLIQAILQTLTNDQKAASCGAVEPSSNRYWCFIPNTSDANGVGKIFVFSYFPSSQIAAWSQYDPSYQVAVTPASKTYTVAPGARYVWTKGSNETALTCGTQVLTKSGSFIVAAAVTTAVVTCTSINGTLTRTTYFTPVKFTEYNGQVYCRASDGSVYLYGGSDNVTYDNCGVLATTPYYDSQSPATRKDFESVDAAFEGTWIVQAGADYMVGTFKTVYSNTQPSFMYQKIGWGARGTHYAFSMTEDGNGYARFASIIAGMKPGEEK
jgi:hypothetical protein